MRAFGNRRWDQGIWLSLLGHEYFIGGLAPPSVHISLDIYAIEPHALERERQDCVRYFNMKDEFEKDIQNLCAGVSVKKPSRPPLLPSTGKPFEALHGKSISVAQLKAFIQSC